MSLSAVRSVPERSTTVPNVGRGASMATAAVSESGTPRGRTRAYWTAWVATVIFFAGFYSLLVPLPRYLTEIGLPDWQIGMILGAFGVASLLWRTVAGVGVDRWGARRIMLLGAGSLVVGAVCVPMTVSPLLLGGLRLLQAAGYVA